MLTREEIDKILKEPGERTVPEILAAIADNQKLIATDDAKARDEKDKIVQATLKDLQDKYETLKTIRENAANRVTGDPVKDAKRAFWACAPELQAWFAAALDKDSRTQRAIVDACTDKLSSLGYDDVPLGNLGLTHLNLKELMARSVGSNLMRKFVKPEGEKTAMTTATDSGLVPQVFVPYLVDRFYYFSAFRQFVTIIPITSTGAKIPGVYAGLTATNRATEATTSADSSLTTESLTPAILPYSASCEVSRALIQSGLPIPLMEYYLTQLVDAVNVLEWKMFIMGNGTNDWTCGLANVESVGSIHSVSGMGSKAQLAGFNEAVSLLGGEYEMPKPWEDSLMWIVKRAWPPILLEKTKTSIGTYLAGMIDLKQCLGYPWIHNYASDYVAGGASQLPGQGWFCAMKAFFLFEVPELMRLGTTSEGTYAMKDSVGMFLHTYTDGMLGTYKRSADLQAAVKLLDMPTAM